MYLPTECRADHTPLYVASVGVANRPGSPRTFPVSALKAHVPGHLSVSSKPGWMAFVDQALTVACGAPAPPSTQEIGTWEDECALGWGAISRPACPVGEGLNVFALITVAT